MNVCDAERLPTDTVLDISDRVSCAVNVREGESVHVTDILRVFDGGRVRLFVAVVEAEIVFERCWVIVNDLGNVPRDSENVVEGVLVMVALSSLVCEGVTDRLAEKYLDAEYVTVRLNVAVVEVVRASVSVRVTVTLSPVTESLCVAVKVGVSGEAVIDMVRVMDDGLVPVRVRDAVKLTVSEREVSVVPDPLCEHVRVHVAEPDLEKDTVCALDGDLESEPVSVGSTE